MRFRTQVSTKHEDIVHDLAYDFYGKRLATCSSDQSIKVFDQNEAGEWVQTCTWKAHTGSIWKIAWAHPEFGQVLASCSFDNTTMIWEEQDAGMGGLAGPAQSAWNRKATLVDSRESVNDIKFSPRHQGLRLATCSASGVVRVYEAPDVINLSVWSVVEQLDAKAHGGNAISWNPSRFAPPMMVVGGTAHEAQIWEYDEGFRRWRVVETLAGHTGEIHDVAWAPNMGRRHELIATASKDGHVRLWRVVIHRDVGQIEAACVAVLGEDAATEIWRVQFNITGTVLASSGDDGSVRLWKNSPLLNEWRPFLQIASDDAEAHAHE